MNIKGILVRLRGSQLIKDSFWSLIGNAVGKGFALLAGIFIARLLGKDIFGEYGLIKSTILTIGVFSSFGLGFTSTKFIADYKRENPEYIKLFIGYATKITLAFSGIMAIILMIFAKQIATNIFDAESLTIPLRFLAILIVFNAVTTTQIGILSGLAEFKTLAKINGFIGILTFLLSVILTKTWNFQGSLFALLLVQVVNCIINFIAVRKYIPKHDTPILGNRNLQFTILKFSTPIALQAGVYNFTSWTGSILLVRFANFGELGMYNAAMQWNGIILFIPGILRNVVLSHLSSTSNSKNKHNLILKQTIQINLFATVIPCIVVILLSPWINNIYGESYSGISGLITVAIISSIFMSISNVYAQAYTSIGRTWEMFVYKLLREILLIIGFLIFISIFNGAISMIISNLSASIIFMFLIYYNYKRKW